MSFIHLLQSKVWNVFKKEYGANVVELNSVYINVKTIPFFRIKIGYAPKVNFLLQQVDFHSLSVFCKTYGISFIRFDSPNNFSGTEDAKKVLELLNKYCVKSPRSSISMKTIFINLHMPIADLLSQMHHKRQYNIRLAEKKGVTINFDSSEQALIRFIKLYKVTQNRQKFFGYSDLYLRLLWKHFEKSLFFAEAYFQNNICSSWLILNSEDVYYYLYGASDEMFNSVFPNDLLGFRVIVHTKELGGSFLDLWGANDNKGYTEFKKKFGGVVVEYIPSYDFLLNKAAYYFFNSAYNFFWLLPYPIKKVINYLYKRLN